MRHTNSGAQVIVECTDPYELFSAFESLLSKHLPLRNLHWKSTSRPLRSIETLDVDLVPTKDVGGLVPSTPERRHQIPGLRQTPYLKIYLLRCDDNETYKGSCRKQIKDWVKSSAIPRESKKGSNNQENHDACEWLIVRLVHADTPTATQTRASREPHLGSTDSSDSLANKSRFLGKGSTTVLEKLRADFSSSKSAIDRVAQICLLKSDQQTSSDLNDQIQDVVEKTELAILRSFDLRVRQYEEDIRERDSRRSLPGWNFNTFFILKEGLARGFENVGLFEDALAGYDELALGLEVVVREQLEGESAGHVGKLVHFSEELKDKIQACLQDADDDAGASKLPGFDAESDPAARLQRKDFSFDASKRPFRELILANEISIFDFRLYIFSRQMELLLRSASTFTVEPKSRQQPYRPKHKEHFLPLSKVCKRAVEFITNAARILRHDLELALEINESTSREELDSRTSAISNFILSWVYVAALQVLAQTYSPDLSLPPPEDVLPRTSADSVIKSNRVSMSQRSSTSLPRTSSQISINGPRSGTPTLPNARTGAEELAGARAELYLLASGVVEQIGLRRGWLAHDYGTNSLYASIARPRNTHELAVETRRDSELEKGSSRPAINGLQYRDLRSVFHSQNAFGILFGCLTTFTYRHFLAAHRTKSAEKTLGEIAILKFHAREYELAASCLSRLCSFYGEGQWDPPGAKFLVLYAECLKELGRHGEFVSTLTRLLGRGNAFHRVGTASAADGYLNDMWTYSGKLTARLSTNLGDFFSVTDLTSTICHFEDRDGFYIPFSISFRLGSLQVPGGIELTLRSMHDSSMPIVTLSTGPLSLGDVPTKVEAKSHMNVSGWYFMDGLQIKIGNLTFNHDYKTPRLSFVLDGYRPLNAYETPRFFVYPPRRALEATVTTAPHLHLAHPRSIHIELKTGWNQVEDCSLSLKSATPGLRLRLHEAEVDANEDPRCSSRTGERDGTPVICLSNCMEDTVHTLTIPYTVESADLSVINARLHIEYSTSKGNFVHSRFFDVNPILPISINVQDIFKQTALVSRFTIGPATPVPLRLWSCDMQNSGDDFHIESHVNAQDVVDVFPRQPASLVYRFIRQNSAIAPKDQGTSLGLSVRFSCIDEVVFKAVEKRFVIFFTESPITKLVRPLVAHLLTTLRSRLSAQEFEVIGLCHEIEVWPFEELNWDATLLGFDPRTRHLARTWLKRWHHEHAVIPIYENTGGTSDTPLRSIIVPVEIPAPSLVITVSLELDPQRHGAVLIGQAVAADLRLSYTYNWSRDGGVLEENRPPIEISFEIIASPENWVVGGTRKGHVLVVPASSKEPTHSSPVILLPQRTGHLLLPSIDVRCYKIAGLLSIGTGPAVEDTVLCDIDNSSLSRSVHVVRGFKETVVDISIEAEATGPSDGEKRSWLVDSKSRKSAVYAGTC